MAEQYPVGATSWSLMNYANKRHTKASERGKPKFVASHTALDTALACHVQGQLQEAEKLYRQILAVQPNNADSRHLLGMIAFQSGDYGTAATMIREAIAINPRAASYHSNLGNVLQRQGQARDAASCYLQAFAINPKLAEVQVNLAHIFLLAGDLEQAVIWYERALELDPGSAEANKSLGDAFRRQSKFGAAVDCYKKAVTLRPDYAEAFNELGGVLRGTGDLSAALTNFRAVQAIEPNHPRAAFSEAMVLLLLGEFSEGWGCYERRWASTDHATPMREYTLPFWKGTRQETGKVLLWAEQGVGDEIMFAGLIPDAVRTGSRCVLECDARLEPLFTRSFPEVEVISDRDAADDPARRIAAQLPIASLPSLFRPDRASFAATLSPYLKADPARLQELRSRYADGRKLVGVAWYSNNKNTGTKRSIDLSQLAPLLHYPGVRWVSLQYGEHDVLEQQAAAAQVPLLIDADIDQMTSMDDFAAQVAAMDLVITIDNTTAHLAGALGIPVWLLLPQSPDWRWMAQGSRSPWYPTMSLFREQSSSNWAAVVGRVVEALASLS